MDTDKYAARFSELSPRTAAMIAGLGLLTVAVLAPFANFYVLQNLVVANDARATAHHNAASSGLFRMGVSCFVVVAGPTLVAGEENPYTFTSPHKCTLIPIAANIAALAASALSAARAEGV